MPFGSSGSLKVCVSQNTFIARTMTSSAGVVLAQVSVTEEHEFSASTFPAYIIPRTLEPSEGSKTWISGNPSEQSPFCLRIMEWDRRKESKACTSS